MGGLTGIWLTIRRPSYFDKIVVSNTAAKIGKSNQKVCVSMVCKGIADTASSRQFTDDFVKNNPEVVKNISQNLAKGDKEACANCYEALAIGDLRDDLKDLQVPMLVIAGSTDPVTTVADGEFIVEHAPNATLAIIETSHIANVEKAETFNQIIASRLN